MTVPEPEFPFRRSTPIQVRFTDCDMLGHINNNTFLAYMDLAKIDYFRSAIPDLDMRRINVAVVNLNADFYAQGFLGEPLSVLTAVSHIGRSSFTMEQRCVNTDTGQVKCICRTVMAAFDPATAKSTPVDATMADAIAAFEQRQLRDPEA